LTKGSQFVKYLEVRFALKETKEKQDVF